MSKATTQPDRKARPPRRRVPRLPEKAPDGRGTNQRPRWNVKEAIALRLKGMTYQQIADKYGVHPSTIHEQLQGVFALIDPQRLEAYQDYRTTILSAVELAILDLLTDKDKREKASLNNVAYTFTQLHQARRLESGQSTQNLALHQIVEAMERERKKEPKELTEETAENERQPENV